MSAIHEPGRRLRPSTERSPAGAPAPRQPGSPNGGAGRISRLSWRRLLVGFAVALPLILIAGTVAVGELMPPIVVFAALFLAGGIWSCRSRKAGPITVGVLSAAFVASIIASMGAAVTVPASTVDFLLSTVTTLIAVAAIVAAVGVLRGRNSSTRAPRAVALTTVSLLIALAGVAAAARIAYEEPSAAADDVALSTRDMEFVPATITAQSGDITLFVQNQDSILHTLTIDELGVDLQIPGNTEARVTFDAAPGQYEIVCVPHAGMGMTGTLEVD